MFSFGNPISGKIFIRKSWAKILSSSQIAGFFDYQYLWNQCISIFDFFHGDIRQGDVFCEFTEFGWVCPGMPRNTQTCLDLPGGWSWEHIQIKNNSKQNISSFLSKFKYFFTNLIDIVLSYRPKCDLDLIVNISGRKQLMS